MHRKLPYTPHFATNDQLQKFDENGEQRSTIFEIKPKALGKK